MIDETKTNPPATLRSASQIRRICRLIFCRRSLDVRGFDVLMQLRSEQDHEGTSSAQGDGIWDLPGANLSEFKHLEPFHAVLACANQQMAGSSSFQLIKPFMVSADKTSHPHLKDAIITEIKIKIKELGLYKKGQQVVQGSKIGTICKPPSDQTVTVHMNNSKEKLTEGAATIDTAAVTIYSAKEKEKGAKESKITMPARLLEHKSTAKYVMRNKKDQPIAYVHIVPENHPTNWVPMSKKERGTTIKIKGYAWIGVSKVTNAITNSCKLKKINLLGSGNPVSNETFLSTNMSRIFRGNALAKAMMSQAESIQETGSTATTTTGGEQSDRLRAKQWCNKLLQHEIHNNSDAKWNDSTWQHAFKGSWQIYDKEHGLSKTVRFKKAIEDIVQKKHNPEKDNTLYNLVAPPNNSGKIKAPSFVHALPYLSLAYVHLGDLFLDDATEFLAEYVSKVVNGISTNSNNNSSESFQFDPILFYVGSQIEQNLVLSNALLRTFDRLCPSKQWLSPEEERSVTSEGRQDAIGEQKKREETIQREEKEKDELTGAHKQWNDLKKETINLPDSNPLKHKCPALDELMEKWVGLEKVKQKALDIYIQTRNNVNLHTNARGKQILNFVFQGNPGTGKTTVARQFGKILFQVGVREATNDTTEVRIVLDQALPFREGGTVVQGSISGTISKLGTATNPQGHVKDMTVKMNNPKETLTQGVATTIDNVAVVVKSAQSTTTTGPPVFIETYPAKLMNEGQKKFDALIESAIGGVLFIDEAYSLNPGAKPAGQPIFDTLMLAASNHKSDLTIILAGYKDDLETKLYSYNVGLKRRFPIEITFDDFSESELLEIWENELEKSSEKNETSGAVVKQGWVVQERRVSVVAARRIARGIGRKGHGNAAAIVSLFEKAKEAAMSGKNFDPENLVITMIDVIGPDPSDRTKIPLLDQALKKLEEYTGLHQVKKAIRELVAAASENYKREQAGYEIHNFALNRLFVGNPGTGKTSIAEIYGMVLKALRYLSDGTVEYKTANDFIGSAIGESEKKTEAIIENCQGKVLLIDEAYILDDAKYGKKALDAMVALVSAKPGADMAVIMAGYEKEMFKMLRDQNPGLSRLFDPASALHFEDFDNQSLGLILKRKCRSEALKMSMSVRRAVVQELSMLRSLPNFGNAGAVESMLSEAKKKAISRIQKENKESETKTNTNGTMTLIQEDFGIGDKKDPYETLSKMLRMDKIVTHFKEIEASIKMTDSMPQLSRPLLSNYLFLGNSGTGKTTVAKCMASIFYNMGAPNGMLPTDRCVVISAASLCGTFVGQAQDIVRKQFEEAIGGVLLIDEAYELGKSSYGEEALTTIVALLTEDDFKGKLICILAGYVKDMNQMLDTNQGARSRFASTLLFDDWNPNDCALLCVKHANDKGIQLDIKDKKISDALIKGFRDIKNRGRFANARDVETVSEMMFNAYSLRMYKENNVVKTEEDEEEEDGDVLPAYNLNDINGAVANMLEQRPQETIFDKTAAANRANRRGNVATQSATQIIQESIENQNQNENQNETKTNGADGGAEAGDGNENEMVQENVSLAPEALAARENFELALVGMNYDLQTANDVLQNIVKNGTYPDDLMQKLIELTGKSEAEICAMMLPQVEQLAESMKETLEEEERKRVAEEALRKTIQDIEDEKERIRQALEAARLLEEAARRAEEQRLEAEREELQRREDQKRREMAAANLEKERQQKLRVIGRCSAGYAWVHKGNGLYNCSAGGHWHQF